MSNTQGRTILYVGNEPGLARALKKNLAQENYELDSTSCGEAGLTLLGRKQYDLLLINHTPPVCDGLEIISNLAAQEKLLPAIIIIEAGAEKVAIAAMKTGAADYIVRDVGRGYLHLLPVVIEKTLEQQRLVNEKDQLIHQITEHKRSEEVVHRCQDIVNNMQLGLYVYHLENLEDDRSLRMIVTNPAATQFTGLAMESVLGKTLDENFPELRELGIPQLYAEIVRTKKSLELEQEIYYGDGRISEAWFSFKAFPLPHNCVGVLFEDITLRKQAEESLRVSERRYRAIIEDQTELICRYLPDGILTFINEAYSRYFSETRETLIGRNITSLDIGVEPDKLREFLTSSDPDNPVRMVVQQVVMPNGEVRWQQWTDRAIFDDQGRLFEFQSVGRDITKLKRAEEEIRRQAEILTALHETALDLAAQRSLSDLLQAIVRRAVKLLNALGGALWIYRSTTDDLELVLNYRLEPDMSGTILQKGEGLAGKVLESGRPVVLDNYSQWEGQSPQYKGTNFGASISVPIVWGDRTLGVLNVLDNPPRIFTPEDIAILERFTPLAAAALEQTRLLEEAQTRWREAETLRQAGAAVTQTLSLDDTLNRIMEQLNLVIPHDRASIQLLRAGFTEIVSDRGYPESGSVVGLKFPIPSNNLNTRVIEGRKPVIMQNIQASPPPSFLNQPGIKIDSWLGAPLIVRDQVIGMLALASARPAYFKTDHIRLVLPFANQVAVAIENARLYEQARQDAEIKSVLLKEVNHRVKNNLAAIIGLLYAERYHARGEYRQPTYEAIIEDLINRLQGLATVHNLLSASEWQPILLSELVTQIIHSSLRVLPFDKQVSVEVSPSPVRVTASQANSLALIVNELTINTLKYGLSPPGTGQITVQIRLDEKEGAERPSSSDSTSQGKESLVVLEFRDNGPGYPEAVLNLEYQNVGLYLVQTLVHKELKGDLTLYNDGGPITTIRFNTGYSPPEKFLPDNVRDEYPKGIINDA